MTTSHADHSPLRSDQITAVVGALEDDKLAAIIASGASLEEVAEAFAFANAEDDVVARPLSGRVERVYDILTAGEDWVDEER